MDSGIAVQGDSGGSRCVSRPAYKCRLRWTVDGGRLAMELGLRPRWPQPPPPDVAPLEHDARTR